MHFVLGMCRPVQRCPELSGMSSLREKNMCFSGFFFFFSRISIRCTHESSESVVPPWCWTTSPATPKVSQIANPVEFTSSVVLDSVCLFLILLLSLASTCLLGWPPGHHSYFPSNAFSQAWQPSVPSHCTWNKIQTFCL